MKLFSAAALALFVSAPAFATPAFFIDFERTWSQSNGDINAYYSGGAAANGMTGGPNLGVSFVNISGLNNDSVTTFFSNAPSPLGIAYAHDNAYINLAAALSGSLTFFYSTPVDALGAITAWSGLNGTGTLLGTINLFANDDGSYGTWSAATLRYLGQAQSFNFSSAALSGAAFDNIRAVPEPGSLALIAAAGGALALRRRKSRRA